MPGRAPRGWTPYPARDGWLVRARLLPPLDDAARGASSHVERARRRSRARPDRCGRLDAGPCALRDQLNPLETLVLGSPGDAATLRDRPSLDLLQISREVDWAGVADRGAHRERVDGRCRLLEIGDALEVDASRNHDAHVLVPSEIEASADLLDQVGGDPSALGRRVEAHPPQPFAERVGHPQ